LNQELARPTEFRDYAFAAYDAAKESGRRFAKRVLGRSFPGHEMAGVNNITLAGLQGLTMNCAEG
jgi:hypothetical protein